MVSFPKNKIEKSEFAVGFYDLDEERNLSRKKRKSKTIIKAGKKEEEFGRVVPVLVGALGSVSKSLIGHLEQLGIPDRTKLSVQKSALLDRDISLKR